ncbi:MAG: molybdopterin cofactor-binding domain-containing protein [Acidobacteriota bacterium]
MTSRLTAELTLTLFFRSVVARDNSCRRAVQLAERARTQPSRRHQSSAARLRFGAPQSIFAMERHLNKVAQTVGLSPEELRRRNFLQPGETTSTGQVINEKIDLSSCSTARAEA